MIISAVEDQRRGASQPRGMLLLPLVAPHLASPVLSGVYAQDRRGKERAKEEGIFKLLCDR